MRKLLAAALVATLSLSPIAFADKPEGKSKSIPYGLQKKQAKGESLPPGWQKKLQVGSKIDQEVFDHGKVILEEDQGLVTIKLEGKLVKIIENTNEIVEIINTI